MGDGFSPRGGRPRRDAETSKGPGNLRNELDDELDTLGECFDVDLR